MNILIALTYYRPHYSGLTIYAEREARALAARGHRVTILTSRFDKSLPAHEIHDGVEIVRLDVWFRISKGVIMPSILPQAWKLARKADIVHLHAPQLDAAPLALMARMLQKPVVLTYHCDLSLPSGFVHYLANQASNLANQVTARAADIIIHNTQDYADHSHFLQPFLGKVRAVYPPVEVVPISEDQRTSFRQKYNLLPGQRIVGMAARLVTEKGVEYLAEALPLVLQKHPNARVLFVGPYRNLIGEEQYAQKVMPVIERLGEHWTFLGVVTPEEMSAFFHESEVTVLPSINRTDSFGIVQVESIASGTPVVASDLPGIRIPVLASGCGIITPPADSKALAQAIIKILDQPEAYQGQPQKILEACTPQRVAQEYEQIFIHLNKKYQEKRHG